MYQQSAPALNLKSLCANLLSRKSEPWTSQDFVTAFDNLRIPITTAEKNLRLIQSWTAEEVWEPYWESIKGHCQNDPSCLELLQVLMAKTSNPKLQTGQHRKLLQNWLDRYAVGYTAVFES